MILLLFFVCCCVAPSISDESNDTATLSVDIPSEFTLHYRTQHIDFSANLSMTNATEYEITDQWNNTYHFDQHGTITINHDVSLLFGQDEDWREIRFKQVAKRRRLFLFLAPLAIGLFAHFFRYYAYHCNWFTRTFIGCRTWAEHPKRIPPDGGYAAFYWKRRRFQAARYIGKCTFIYRKCRYHL